jgi:large subunit ribosomal protein L31
VNPSKEELECRGGWVLKKTQSLTESVGLVRRPGASANGSKNNLALFSFYPSLLDVRHASVNFATENFNPVRQNPYNSAWRQASNHTIMKKGIHPGNYRLVVFKDMSNGHSFLSRSTAPSKETVKWEDGNEYPLVKLEISNTSHPFFTGKNVLVDTAGRIDKFKKKYEKKK